MKRGIGLLLAVLVCAQLIAPAFGAGGYVPSPQTAYARDFVAKCENQQWFLEEIERQLTLRQKSVNTLTGAADLDFIISLGARDAQIDGVIPSAIGELHGLKLLFLSGNRLHGPIPASLYALPALERIDLSGNAFSGPIPAAFGGMAALKMLNLRGNAFTGSVPNSVLTSTGLTFLDIANNKLTGGLPVGPNYMLGLEYLAVSDNAWGGALPELSALTELKTLSAWGCGLTGTIPDSLYTLSKLQILDLAGNELTGGMAAALGNLTQLQLLSLGDNALTGPIPRTLSGLTALTSLDLSNNKLDGTIPDCFGGLTSLESLRLEDNMLRGLLPGSLETRLDAGLKLYAQNNYLTGEALKKAAQFEKNFCDGAENEQYRIVGPDRLRISETAVTEVFAQLQNRNLVTGDMWLKPLLPTGCYTAMLENDVSGKVLLVSDGAGIRLKVVPLTNPGADNKQQEITPAENIRLVVSLTDNTNSSYSKISILLSTEVAPVGGGGGAGASSKPSLAEHAPYVDGYPNHNFGPADAITREQAAKLVMCALDAPVGDAAAYSHYHDVDRTRWSAPYIEYARDRAYLFGVGGGAFRPTAQMSRAEFATYLVRVWGGRAYDEANAPQFSDVTQGAWYAPYVQKAAAIGLIKGLPDGSFRPNAPISRAEAVTILNRLLRRTPETALGLATAPSPFPDVTVAHWAYLDILEAGVAHQHEEAAK